MQSQSFASEVRYLIANGVTDDRIVALMHSRGVYPSATKRAIGWIKNPRKRGPSPSTLSAIREAARERNQPIVDAVASGMTYSEAAEKFGMTRSAVAGICDRHGLRVGPRPADREKLSESARRSWADPVKRAKRLAKLRARNENGPRGIVGAVSDAEAGPRQSQ